MSEPTQAVDAVAARLAAIRAAYRPAADKFAERDWTDGNDAYDDMGPSGIHQWNIGASARQVLDLVDALEAVAETTPSMHGDHQPIPDECRYCKGEAAALARIRELVANHLADTEEENAEEKRDA